MFMIPINDAEFDRLMGDKLKVPKNGTISYREFLRRFQHGENVQKGHPWLFSQHRWGCFPVQFQFLIKKSFIIVSFFRSFVNNSVRLEIHSFDDPFTDALNLTHS